MNHNRSSTTRQNWKFNYFGRDLLDHAVALRDKYTQDETSAREKLSILMKDPNIGMDHKDVIDLRSQIETSSFLRTEYTVYAHEFKRNPDREYNLEIGDVIFFNLTN